MTVPPHDRSKPPRASSRQLTNALAQVGRAFHARGWALGTSGNFSAVLQREPLQLLITASGLDKAALNVQHFLEIDGACNVLRGSLQPSAEALLHLAVARVRGASAILHTHSVWGTLLSDLHAAEGGLAISGYEMLKGLEGFLLTPIDTETFQLAMEDWSIWQRWELAFKTGKADISTHPALPHEAMRHAELKPILDRTLVTNPEKAVTKTGRFEPLGEQTLPIGVLRALQVKWTEPLMNLNGTLRTMRFPNENDE